jgi:single-strand DNA-binding protein
MSINKVILIGNVGKDPDVRYFENGNCVANFTLATTERGYTAANGTLVPDHTDWHNIVLWSNLAKLADKYIKKGSKLYIEGKIRTRSYDDAAGNKRYVTEIYGEVVELLGKKPDTQTAADGNADLHPNEETASQPEPAPPLEESKGDLPF